MMIGSVRGTVVDSTGGTSEGNFGRCQALGRVDIGWRPAAAVPGLAYLEKRV